MSHMLLLIRMSLQQAPSASLCIHLLRVGKHGQCCWPQASSVAHPCRTFLFRIHCHVWPQIADPVYWSIPGAGKSTETAVVDETRGPSSTASCFQQGKARLLPGKCLRGLRLQRFCREPLTSWLCPHPHPEAQGCLKL